MKFCILIELSKESITFLYNRSDSDNGFVPFVGQGPLPLAIYCKGNQMEIGQFAVEEANKQDSCAFTDVFSKMRDGGTFKYRGEEKPSNMLLFSAIQSCLSSFFDSTLIGQMGRLEQNVATMPLCFLFHADVDENERLFVRDSFDRSGFANVIVRDCDQLAMRTIGASSANCLCVTSNGQDLFVNIYTHDGKQVSSLVICRCGRDPRLDVAVDKLWDSIGFENANLDRCKEQPILSQIAENFLDSGKYSFNESVTLSEGYSYNVGLTLRELDLCRVEDNGKAMVEVMRKLSGNQIRPSDCTVILQGKAANNSFFADMFKREFGSVRSVDHTLRTEMLANLLDEVKKSDYVFGTRVPPKAGNPISPNPFFPFLPIPPTKRDERDLKVLCRSVETCLVNGHRKQAETDIKDFLRQIHERNVHAFDQELQDLLDKVANADVPINSPKNPTTDTIPPANSKPVPDSSPVQVPEPPVHPPHALPSKRDERDMKMLGREVAAYIKRGETDQAKRVVDEFRQAMHDKDIYAFDTDLGVLLDKALGPSSQPKPESKLVKLKPHDAPFVPGKPVQHPLPDTNQGMLLMRENKFREAREWFRSQGQGQRADDCTSIIRWLRLLPTYESELPSTRETRNRDKARARIHEIDVMLALYARYQIDVSRLEKLRTEYRNIK